MKTIQLQGRMNDLVKQGEAVTVRDGKEYVVTHTPVTVVEKSFCVKTAHQGTLMVEHTEYKTTMQGPARKEGHEYVVTQDEVPAVLKEFWVKHSHDGFMCLDHQEVLINQ